MIQNLLVNDDKAFRKALRHQLQPLGAAEILPFLKQIGQITSVKVVLERIESKGDRINPEIYQHVLREAGER